MAKAKKVKEVIEEPKSVTLEEVKEVEKVEIPEPIKDIPIIGEGVSEKGEAKYIAPNNLIEDLPMEQKIEKFLEGREGYVRANDFLKSLFGIPKLNEPAQWLQQGNSKLLKSILEGMVLSNDITVKDNLHRLLGKSYYPNSTTGKQEHRSLNNVEIFIRK